jgi:hypothetical protein
MPNPGKILIRNAQDAQELFDVAQEFSRWYRIDNQGPKVMGVDFVSASRQLKSAQVAPGTSMDFLALQIVIRNDSLPGEVKGTYESLDGTPLTRSAVAVKSRKPKRKK